MANASTPAEIPRLGRPAVATRLFGWIMLTTLAAFLLNNVLVVWFDMPGLRGLSEGGFAWMNALVFALAIGAAFVVVLNSQDRSLRWDAHLIHSFNLYLIRALFWSIFLVGLTDAAVAFMRVEGVTEILGESMNSWLKRPTFIGPWIHVPLIVFGFVIALFSKTLGFPWLALLIVVAELLIVISRFVFSYEQALMGDLVRYWYAALFLFSSAYTLFEEGHVRVDIVYAGLSRASKGMMNSIGTIMLGMTTMWVIILISFNGKQSIINAPVKNFEISQSGPFGMYVKYQMAAFIGLFAITMLIQFVSYYFDAVADKRGEAGHRTPASDAAH